MRASRVSNSNRPRLDAEGTDCLNTFPSLLVMQGGGSLPHICYPTVQPPLVNHKPGFPRKIYR